VPVQGTTAASSDFERAAYGLLVGRNPGGALVTYTWGVSFGRGKKNGMQVTVVDPRKPSEAGESDAEWLPIRPGTDAAFLLAVMQLSAAGMDKEFFDLYGTPNTVGYGDTCFNALLVGLGAICGGRLDRGVPVQGTTAASSDFERAAYGLLVGRIPGGALVTYTWGVSFGRGKKNGMQVTVVDPRKPSEAGESDAEWLPIRPGTDAAFLLAVMQVVLERK